MTIEQMVAKKNGSIFPCVTLLLYWLISSDGTVDDSEISFLKGVTPNEDDYSIDDYLSLLRNSFSESVYNACRILSRSLGIEGGARLVELMIGLMIADNRASYPEIHIIRFVADLFCISKKQLDRLFSRITGKEFPEPGNLGSIKWWGDRESKQHENKHEYAGSNEKKATTYGGQKREWALKVLGLSGNCSDMEIRQAYRHLCNQHHPDRFELLGPEAVAAANVIFRTINEAYEVLTAT